MASSPALDPASAVLRRPPNKMTSLISTVRSPTRDAATRCPTKNRLAAVGAETHAVERGVVGGVAAVVHAVGLGGRHVLEEVHVGAGNNTGVA